MNKTNKRVVQHADNVWSFRHDWERVEPAIGMILTDEGWVAVDGGSSPKHGHLVFEAMQEIAPKPAVKLIATHRHFDHTFGHQAFNAPIVSCQRCKDRMDENMKDDWSDENALDWLKRDMFPYISGLKEEDFEGLRLIAPQETFASEHSMKIGGVSFEMFMLDGVHTDDSIGVYLPDNKIMFLSDALYYLEGPEGSFLRLFDLFQAIEARDVDLFVPGHERHHNVEIFERVKNYCAELQESVMKFVDERIDEKRITEIPFNEEYKGNSFLGAKFHKRLLRAAYRELANSQQK